MMIRSRRVFLRDIFWAALLPLGAAAALTGRERKKEQMGISEGLTRYWFYRSAS